VHGVVDLEHLFSYLKICRSLKRVPAMHANVPFHDIPLLVHKSLNALVRLA